MILKEKQKVQQIIVGFKKNDLGSFQVCLTTPQKFHFWPKDPIQLFRLYPFKDFSLPVQTLLSVLSGYKVLLFCKAAITLIALQQL